MAHFSVTVQLVGTVPFDSSSESQWKMTQKNDSVSYLNSVTFLKDLLATLISSCILVRIYESHTFSLDVTGHPC